MLHFPEMFPLGIFFLGKWVYVEDFVKELY